MKILTIFCSVVFLFLKQSVENVKMPDCIGGVLLEATSAMLMHDFTKLTISTSTVHAHSEITNYTLTHKQGSVIISQTPEDVNIKMYVEIDYKMKIEMADPENPDKFSVKVKHAEVLALCEYQVDKHCGMVTLKECIEIAVEIKNPIAKNGEIVQETYTEMPNVLKGIFSACNTALTTTGTGHHLGFVNVHNYALPLQEYQAVTCSLQMTGSTSCSMMQHYCDSRFNTSDGQPKKFQIVPAITNKQKSTEKNVETVENLDASKRSSEHNGEIVAYTSGNLVITKTPRDASSCHPGYGFCPYRRDDKNFIHASGFNIYRCAAALNCNDMMAFLNEYGKNMEMEFEGLNHYGSMSFGKCKTTPNTKISIRNMQNTYEIQADGITIESWDVHITTKLPNNESHTLLDYTLKDVEISITMAVNKWCLTQSIEDMYMKSPLPDFIYSTEADMINISKMYASTLKAMTKIMKPFSDLNEHHPRASPEAIMATYCQYNLYSNCLDSVRALCPFASTETSIL